MTKGKRTPLGIHLAAAEAPPYTPDMAREINNLKKAIAVAYQRIASQTKMIADMTQQLTLAENALNNRCAALEKRLAGPKPVKRIVKAKPPVTEEAAE